MNRVEPNGGIGLFEVDELVGQAFCKDGFALLDDFGFKGSVPVAWGIDFKKKAVMASNNGE